jgi:outer membrane protein OmpA-like peptidoglycan-associated protein
MKQFLSLLLCAGLFVSVHAQSGKKPYFGVLAGANFSNQKVDPTWSTLSTSGKVGFVGGLFGNLPISKVVSFQPEVQYAQFGAKATYSGTVSDKGTHAVEYVAVPLFAKFNLGERFAFLLGPQINFLGSATHKLDAAGSIDKGSVYKGSSFAADAGIEVFATHNLFIWGRYVMGLTDINHYWSDLDGNPITSKVKDNAFQVGLGWAFRKKPAPVVVAPPPPPVIPDTDGDGIFDNVDKCPTVAGLAKYGGCPIPDTDKDGINDEQDKCPTTPGLAKYNGCPIPDTDNDGVNDEQDKCPTVAGLAKYQGCPPPDRDGDGVIDEEDKCPDVAGPASNGGCPALESTKFNASMVQFNTGTATLTPSAQKGLNEAAVLLNDPKYAPLKVSIEGHTDNVGKPASNKTLSEKRAAAVKAYLVKKGVSADRLSSSGFGDTAPIADNKTKAGKAANRRVEFKVSE